MQSVQPIEKVVLCTKCSHPRESHVKSQTLESAPGSSYLLLRSRCSANGCSCLSFVGLVWERAEPDKAQG